MCGDGGGGDVCVCVDFLCFILLFKINRKRSDRVYVIIRFMNM